MNTEYNEQEVYDRLKGMVHAAAHPLLQFMQHLYLVYFLAMYYFETANEQDVTFLGWDSMFCLLLGGLIPFLYRFWRRQYRQKEKQLWYQEKVENPELTAWKTTEYPKSFPWYIPYIFLVVLSHSIVYDFSVGFFVLAALSLVQYVLGVYMPNRRDKNNLPSSFRKTYYERFRASEDGSYIWPDYSNYALLMKDDTNRVPVTFNRGIQRPDEDSYFFYDLEKDINNNPKFQDSSFRLWFYLHSKLFVYVLEVAKYEDIQAEIENALTFARHEIAKPVYIFLLTKEPQKLQEILDVYDWMPLVSIKTVTDIQEIDLSKVQDDQLIGSMITEMQGYAPFRLKELGEIDKSDFFRSCNYYSSYIYKEIPRIEDMYYYNASNYYLCGFFQNMFRNAQRKQAILAGFDYVDMVLRFVLYHFAVKKGVGFQERLVEDNIQFLGEEILKLLDEKDYIYETAVVKSVPINNTVENALLILSEYFPLRFEGKEINFCGLLFLLRVLRNQTRGHGSIQDAIVNPLWYALYVLFVLFSFMLRVDNFEIHVKGDRILTGYSNDGLVYPMGEYGMISSDMPCLLYQLKKNKREYINYFKGDIIVPHIINDGEEDS